MSNVVPMGMVPGNFLGTVLNTIRISLLDIIGYMRTLPSYEERFIVGQAIGVRVANELTEGGLEYHDEYKRIVSRIPAVLARPIEHLTEMILVMEEGQIRRGMFGIVMRIIGTVSMEGSNH